MKKIILSSLLVIVGVVVLGQVVYAGNANLFVSPATASKNVGAPFNIAVLIDPQGNQACVVKGTLIFSNLTCRSIALAPGIMAMTTPTCANPSFTLGIPKCATAAQNVLTVSVKGNSIGQAKLSFAGANVIGAGTALVFTASGGAYNITAVPVPTPTPAPTNPTTPCTPDWQTGPWGICTDSQQTRTVADLNNCGVTTDEPDTIQSCTPPVLFDIAAQPAFKTSKTIQIFLWIAISIFLVLIVILIFWAYKKRKKD